MYIDRHNKWTDSIFKHILFLLLPTSELGFLKALGISKITGCTQGLFLQDLLFTNRPCHWVKLKIRDRRTLPRSHSSSRRPSVRCIISSEKN